MNEPWANGSGAKRISRAEPAKRTSKLDPHKGTIGAAPGRASLHRPATAATVAGEWLHRRSYSSDPQGICARRASGPRQPAFLEAPLCAGAMRPGGLGCGGDFLPVGSTRRQAFLLSSWWPLLQSPECMSSSPWLQTCRNTFWPATSTPSEYSSFAHSVPAEVMVDKSARPPSCLHSRWARPAVLHPRYLDFARHFGFLRSRRAGPAQPQEKGRVENGVGYFKKNSPGRAATRTPGRAQCGRAVMAGSGGQCAGAWGDAPKAAAPL